MNNTSIREGFFGGSTRGWFHVSSFLINVLATSVLARRENSFMSLRYFSSWILRLVFGALAGSGCE